MLAGSHPRTSGQAGSRRPRPTHSTGRAHIAYRETAGGAAGPTDIVYDHTFGDTKRLFAGLNGSIRPTSAEESGLEEGQYLMQPPSISLTKGASFVRLP